MEIFVWGVATIFQLTLGDAELILGKCEWTSQHNATEEKPTCATDAICV